MTREQVIALLRKRCGESKTQAEAAEALGITPAYLSDVLNGRRDPGPKVLTALGLQKSYEKAR